MRDEVLEILFAPRTKACEQILVRVLELDKEVGFYVVGA